jgi:hypothetical protein
MALTTVIKAGILTKRRTEFKMVLGITVEK